MRLVSFLHNGTSQLGFLQNDLVYPAAQFPGLPGTMTGFLQHWQRNMQLAENHKNLLGQSIHHFHLQQVQLLAPVSQPPSYRDAYAFRQHVATARRNRGLPMAPEFDQFPVFYFSNHHTIVGPGPVYCMPDHFHQLDFELEAAIVIGVGGKNITASQADEHIAGLMILNDLSARQLQMEEMKLSLGPAKGKDFASVTGPALVTLSELTNYEVPSPAGHTGKCWSLQMTCSVNGRQVSSGNLADMNWTFAEIIERASYGAELYPGDIIGSGTVGTGCFLELNGTARLADPQHEDEWLHEGDEVVLQIEQLGSLSTTIKRCNTEHSILQNKR